MRTTDTLPLAERVRREHEADIGLITIQAHHQGSQRHHCRDEYVRWLMTKKENQA